MPWGVHWGRGGGIEIEGCSLGGIEIDTPETYFADVSPLIRTCDELCFSYCGSGVSCSVCVSFPAQPYLITYLRTYLLIPWCRVLEKLTGLQLVKKFPTFHGTRRFITALTSVRHLSLYWASSIQSIYPHPTSCRSILILSTHLRLGLYFPTNSRYIICRYN